MTNRQIDTLPRAAADRVLACAGQKGGEAVSDQPTTLYPNGSMGTLVYVERKCCDCNDKPASWTADGARCQGCWMTHIDREHGKHWADHGLRRVETDPEFRERLRAALGVTP